MPKGLPREQNSIPGNAQATMTIELADIAQYLSGHQRSSLLSGGSMSHRRSYGPRSNRKLKYWSIAHVCPQIAANAGAMFCESATLATVGSPRRSNAQGSKMAGDRQRSASVFCR
jgi:hypothetical protein